MAHFGPRSHPLEASTQVSVLSELPMKEGVEENEGLLRRREGRGLDHAAIGSEDTEAFDVQRMVPAGQPHVMDHVALEASGSPVQARDVDPGEVDSPHVDTMRDRPGHMAEHHYIAQGVLDRSSTHQVPTNVVESGPQVGVRVVAPPESDEYPRSQRVDEVLVIVADIERFTSCEEPAVLGKDPEDVHTATMCRQSADRSPSVRPVDNVGHEYSLWKARRR